MYPMKRWARSVICPISLPQNEVGARKLRAALVETLVPVERSDEAIEEITEGERQLMRVRAIRERLGELANIVRESMRERD